MMLLLSFKCVHVQLVLCASQIFKKIKMILNHDKSILFLYLGLKDIVSLLCMMLLFVVLCASWISKEKPINNDKSIQISGTSILVALLYMMLFL
jgi:hypothetical protein